VWELAIDIAYGIEKVDTKAAPCWSFGSWPISARSRIELTNITQTIFF
jgi:hypothetical protein